MIESLVVRSSSTFSSTSASCSSEFWQFWLNASKSHIIVSLTEPNVPTKFLAITLEKEKLYHCELYYINIFSRKFSPDGWKFSKYFDNRPPFRHIQAESWVPEPRNNPGLELPEIAEFFIFLWAIVCNVYFSAPPPYFFCISPPCGRGNSANLQAPWYSRFWAPWRKDKKRKWFNFGEKSLFFLKDTS